MGLTPDIVSKIVQCIAGFNLYKVILFGSYARGTATEDSDINPPFQRAYAWGKSKLLIENNI
jgi:hypothetical protein